jgi:hypothetical protein
MDCVGGGYTDLGHRTRSVLHAVRRIEVAVDSSFWSSAAGGEKDD